MDSTSASSRKGAPPPPPPPATTSSEASSSGAAAGGGSSPTINAPKKRNRIRFSCNTCRDKKLKCSRAQPSCDQCVRRGIGSTCQYVPYLHPREVRHTALPKVAKLAATDQDRLRYLEGLVLHLRRELAERDNPHPASAGASGQKSKPRGPETPGDLAGVLEPSPAGPLVDDLRYVDSSNWEAVLDDVTKMTGELRTVDEDDMEETEVIVDTSLALQPGPVLLLGSFPNASILELVEYLPPKPITDQLISRFFLGKEPAWNMFHVPTFLKQYGEFWDDPQKFSITFVGLLFIMICHAAFFCLRGDEEVPGEMGTPQFVCDVFRIRAAQCLALDDYTKPGKYKVETLILYFGIEYLRVTDAQRGTSIILSIIVRLAMHMGLHRDPTHYQEMSIFEGEMRRRLWTVLTEIDLLVSFQFGLPANIQRHYFDTGLPRSWRDDDFNEFTTKPPPERPQTERTPTLYTIVKSRLVVAFGAILETMSSRNSPTYGDVLRLDTNLEEAHHAIPPILRMRSFSLSVADDVDLIMQRLWIELMYQKARIVLHRRFFATGRTDNRYGYSRFACIDAATRTLQHQFDIHRQMLPGGRLNKDRWFLSSLSTHDFLLANMILCLELSYLLNPKKAIAETETLPEPIDKERLLQIIRMSRFVWQSRRKESSEANRAFKILNRMLSISTGMQYESSPDSQDAMGAMDNAPDPDCQIAQAPNYGIVPAEGEQPQAFYPPPISGPNPASIAPWMSPEAMLRAHTEEIPAPEVTGGADMAVDWLHWDTQILNPNTETTNIQWSGFFENS